MSENRQFTEQKKRIIQEGFLNGFDLYRAITAGINNLLPYQKTIKKN